MADRWRQRLYNSIVGLDIKTALAGGTNSAADLGCDAAAPVIFMDAMDKDEAVRCRPGGKVGNVFIVNRQTGGACCANPIPLCQSPNLFQVPPLASITISSRRQWRQPMVAGGLLAPHPRAFMMRTHVTRHLRHGRSRAYKPAPRWWQIMGGSSISSPTARACW
jgi:hypothetical protein